MIFLFLNLLFKKNIKEKYKFYIQIFYEINDLTINIKYLFTHIKDI